MKWLYLPLTYRVLGPVHIGYRSVGIIDRTRYYVPAKNLWAAVTANLTPQLHPNPQANDYQTVGKLVQQHLRFSYFFLAARSVEKPLTTLKFYLPQYQQGLTIYCEYPDGDEVDIKALFVSSYVSTALDYSHHAAAANLLHEIEYLQPHVQIRDDCCETHLVGGVWVALGANPSGVEIQKQEGKILVNGLPALDLLTVGGERGYGFGRLELTTNHTDHLKLGIWEIQERDPTGLCIKPPERSARILAHVKYEIGKDYDGILEPIVGRDWDTRKGAGRLLSGGGVYVAPGGCCPSSSTYAVDGWGFWVARLDSPGGL